MTASNKHTRPLFKAFRLFKRHDLFYLIVPVACGLAITIALLVIYKTLHGTQESEIFKTTHLAIACGAILLIGLGRYAERYFAEVLAQRVVTRIRLEVFNKLLSSTSTDDALHERSSTFIRLTGDMTAARNWIISGLVNGIVLATLLVSSILLLMFVHPYLAVTAIAAFALITLTSIVLGRQLLIANQTQRSRRTRLINRLSQQLASLSTILFFNQSGKESRRYQARNQALAKATLTKAHWTGLLRAASEIIMWGTLIALGIVGMHLVRFNFINTQQLFVILTSSIFLLHRFKNVYRVIESWAAFRPSNFRIQSLLHRRDRFSGKKKPAASPEIPLLIFEAYGKNTGQSDLTLTVQDTDIVVFEPQDPSLDTLLSLPLKPNTPTGRLRIGGVRPNNSDWSGISRFIAIGSRRLPWTDGSVRKNLLYGRRQFSDDEVLSLWDLFTRECCPQLPSKILDSNPESLNIREQVIASVVRAIARKPQCLVLDLKELDDQRVSLKLAETTASVFPGALLIYPSVNAYPAFEKSSYLAQRRQKPSKALHADY